MGAIEQKKVENQGTGCAEGRKFCRVGRSGGVGGGGVEWMGPVDLTHAAPYLPTRE